MKTITVQAIKKIEVDVSNFQPGEIDIEALAIELTRKKVETLSSDDFEYKIKSVQKVF